LRFFNKELSSVNAFVSLILFITINGKALLKPMLKARFFTYHYFKAVNLSNSEFIGCILHTKDFFLEEEPFYQQLSILFKCDLTLLFTLKILAVY
jgi:hypothetical protein